MVARGIRSVSFFLCVIGSNLMDGVGSLSFFRVRDCFSFPFCVIIVGEARGIALAM